MNNAFTEHPSKASSRTLDAYLTGIAKGDRDALANLYHDTSTSVYAFTLSILKNPHDAEDVLQDCYLRIYDSAQQYRSQGKPMAWIMTIARNLCMMRLREQKKTADLSQEDWNIALSQHDEMKTDDKLIVAQCMTLLSDEERQIVTLHAVAGFKHREIASFLGLPLATVISKYNRSLKKLKEYFVKESLA